MKLPRCIKITGFSAFLFSTSPLVAQTDYSTLQVPKQIQYQGRVATSTGAPWTGTEGYFAFALVQGATVLWNNWEGTASPSDPGTVALGAGQVLTLPVSGGVFSVRLGEGSDTNEQVPATVFFDATSNAVRSGVKLAVWFSPDGGTFTRLNPDVDFTSVPYAMVSGIAEAVKERAVTQDMLAITAAVPVGGVIAWWGAKTDIPPGFEICDGAAPITPGALVTVKPDLRGRFPRGAENARANVASSPFTGGSDSIATRISGDVFLSTAQIPNHFHRIQLDTRTDVGGRTGSHTHSIQGPYSSDEDGDGIVSSMTDNENFGDRIFPIYANTSGSTHQHRIDGYTGNNSFSNNAVSADGGGGTTGQAHNHSIPAHDNRPAYLELFYIIRVK
jgi:hypothetical protein